jgi:hypothetical protein
VVVLRRVVDREALAVEPGLDRADLRLGRGEALPELLWRQVVPYELLCGSETALAAASAPSFQPR